MNPVLSNHPTVQPATSEKVYDRWRVVELYAQWPNPNGEMSVTAQWSKYLRDNAGVGEDSSQRRSHRVENLFTLAATNQTVATALVALIEAMKELALAQGVID